MLWRCTTLGKQLLIEPNNLDVPLQRHRLFSWELQSPSMHIFNIPCSPMQVTSQHFQHSISSSLTLLSSTTLFRAIWWVNLGLAALAVLSSFLLPNSLLASGNRTSPQTHKQDMRCYGSLYLPLPPYERPPWSSSSSPLNCSPWSPTLPALIQLLINLRKTKYLLFCLRNSARSRCSSSLLSTPISISPHHT